MDEYIHKREWYIGYLYQERCISEMNGKATNKAVLHLIKRGKETIFFGVHQRMAVITAAFCILYAVFSILFPFIEGMLHSVTVALLFLSAAWEDIKQRQISLVCLCEGFVINAFHTVFYSHEYSVWVAGIAISLVLLLLHLVNRRHIGLGDVLLLGLGICSLQSESILVFLFMAFFFSAVFGLYMAVYQRKMKGLTVPMAPCILLAYIVGSFVL